MTASERSKWCGRRSQARLAIDRAGPGGRHARREGRTLRKEAMGAYLAAPMLPMMTPTSNRQMARKRLQPQMQDFLDMTGAERGLIFFGWSDQDLHALAATPDATTCKKRAQITVRFLYLAEIYRENDAVARKRPVSIFLYVPAQSEKRRFQGLSIT